MSIERRVDWGAGARRPARRPPTRLALALAVAVDLDLDFVVTQLLS